MFNSGTLCCSVEKGDYIKALTRNDNQFKDDESVQNDNQFKMIISSRMMKNITKIQDEKFSSVMWNDEKNGQLGEKGCNEKKGNGIRLEMG
jgi:hypothetical protein